MLINWCMYQSTSKTPYQCCPLILQKIVSYIYGESFLWLLITVVREKMFEIYSPSWIFFLILSLTCSLFWCAATHPKVLWGEAVQLDADSPWSCASNSPLTDRFNGLISYSSGVVHASAWAEVECKGKSFVAFSAGAFVRGCSIASSPQFLHSHSSLLGLVCLNGSVPHGLL